MPKGSATWRDCRRPACGSWRCSAPSTASAARPIRAPRSPRPSIRPPVYQSTVFTAGVPPPPTPCSHGIDLLLVDLQDAGARYYTYLFTTVEVMRSAARRGIRVVVLDRPDPIGGPVQGNVLDPAYRTPVGPARRADAPRHDAGRAGPAGPGRPRARRPTSAWCRWPAGGARCRSTRPGCRSSRRARTSARSRASTTIPGLCLFEGTNLCVGRGIGRAVRADRGAVARHRGGARAGAGARRLPGVRFAGRAVHPERAGRRQVRRHARSPASGSRSPTGRAYDPDRDRGPPARRRPGRPRRRSSPGFPRTSTGWPVGRRCARQIEAGTRRRRVDRRSGWRSRTLGAAYPESAAAASSCSLIARSGYARRSPRSLGSGRVVRLP